MLTVTSFVCDFFFCRFVLESFCAALVGGEPVRHFDRYSLLILLVNVLEVSAEDAALRELLGAVWAVVGLLTIVLAEVNLHVAALGKGLSAAVNETLEEPLLPVGFLVVDLDSLAHLFGDGFVAFLALLLAHVFFF